MEPADARGTALERARVVADTVLFPRAQQTDTADLVPSDNLDALRDAGLNGLQGHADLPGGMGAGPVVARKVFGAVAGGCGATAFVWAQHHGAVRRLAGADGPAAERWLPSMCEGSARAGIGFAYLRRPGPPAIRATPEGDGWRLEGRAPWITGWGLADVFVVMARADDGRVVTVVVDRPYERAELVAGPPQRLMVMRATGTVALGFQGLRAEAFEVAGVQSPEAWALRDRVGSAMPAAAPFGITERAIRLLRDHGSPDALATVEVFVRELESREIAADRLSEALVTIAAGSKPYPEPLLDRGALERDRGLDLARRATDALVAVSGGGAMDLSHPGQRLSREATFYMIQAQTRPMRAASLMRLRRDDPPPPP